MAYIIMILGIFGLDSYVKNRIEQRMAIGEKLYVAKERLIITKFYNKGACLGLLKEHQKVVTCISTIVTVVASLWFVGQLGKKIDVCKKIGGSLVIGGGLSNTYDRIVRHYVVDYVSFGVKWKKLRSIVFNISDFCIIIGTILFFMGRDRKDS